MFRSSNSSFYNAQQNFFCDRAVRINKEVQELLGINIADGSVTLEQHVPFKVFKKCGGGGAQGEIIEFNTPLKRDLMFQRELLGTWYDGSYFTANWKTESPFTPAKKERGKKKRFVKTSRKSCKNLFIETFRFLVCTVQVKRNASTNWPI